ncbi:MAG: type II secretion system F family protein [Pseudomonadota bacterium]|nr:type II secretion system F family protein [Pseudomonadota bacterium]
MFRKKKILATDITELLNHLAILLESGISSSEALHILQQDEEKPALQQLMQHIKKDLDAGSHLADSLAKHPRYFEDFIVDLVRGGELRDQLVAVLNDVVRYRESIEAIELTVNIRNSFIYPAALLAIGLVILSFLLHYVIPVFRDMFSSFGGDLPALTQFLVQLSDFFVANWIIVLAIILILGFYVQREYRKQSWVGAWMELYVPVFGRLFRYIIIIRCLRTVVLMLSHKATIAQAITIAAKTVNNPIYNQALYLVSQQVADGITLAEALLSSKIFPRKMVQAAVVGSKTERLSELFSKLADIYTKQVQQAAKPAIQVLELFLIVLLGIMIGVLVIGLYLPIFKMGEAI